MSSDMSEKIHRIKQAMKTERSKYHLTLGQLMEVLQNVPKEALVVLDNGYSIGNLASYRGYYEDLAFEPIDRISRAWQVLDFCGEVFNHYMEGYKGGHFLMDKDTPLWVSNWGDVSDVAIVGCDLIVLEFAPELSVPVVLLKTEEME